MTSARTTLRRGAGLVALLSALLLVLTFMLIPAARAVEPLPDGPYPALVSGNPFCSDYGLTEVTRFDPVPGATGDVITQDGVTITVTDHKDSDEILAFTWTSTSWISAVIVKAGSDANIYAYDPSVTSGSAVTVGNAGVSHISFCLGEAPEEPEEPDVTLVKAWQDADGIPVDAPEGVTWAATLTLDDESSTTLTVSDTAGDTDTTTTDDGTTYTVAEDDSSEDFAQVNCSEAVQAAIEGTYGGADTIAYDLGNGEVDGDTVHVVCNTVPEITTEEITWDLTVEKDVVGDAGDIADFSFAVTCGEIEETLTIADGGSDAVTDIPEDTSCTVTETTTLPEGTEVTITTSEDSTVVEEATITLDPRSTAITVSFVNTFQEEEVEPDEVVTTTPEEQPEEVEVLPNVVEKPAPTTPPTVAAADELPRTGLSSTQMLLLSLLLMGLGAVMILGPEGRRES